MQVVCLREMFNLNDRNNTNTTRTGFPAGLWWLSGEQQQVHTTK
jgi:hypothetical protein